MTKEELAGWEDVVSKVREEDRAGIRRAIKKFPAGLKRTGELIPVEDCELWGWTQGWTMPVTLGGLDFKVRVYTSADSSRVYRSAFAMAYNGKIIGAVLRYTKGGRWDLHGKMDILGAVVGDV